MRTSVPLLLLIVVLSACQDSDVEFSRERIGMHYFPMEVGSFRIYQIQETRYTLIGSEFNEFQLREQIVDSTLLIDGQVQYEVRRERRQDENSTWEIDSVWTARVSTNRAILIENNVPLVKLVFPIENQLTWDGNAYNTREFDEYRYDRTLADTVLHDQSYENLWTVVQSDFGTDILGRNDRYEVYAPNVGLIIKKSIIWNFCQSDCSSENQIVAGRELLQSIISYGKEE